MDCLHTPHSDSNARCSRNRSLPVGRAVARPGRRSARSHNLSFVRNDTKRRAIAGGARGAGVQTPCRSGARNYLGDETLDDRRIRRRRAAVSWRWTMHVAASLGKPMVSVFGPTNPVHIGPYQRPESVVRVDLPCSPCNYRRLSQCPFDHACMKQVTSAMVVERARKTLATTK